MILVRTTDEALVELPDELANDWIRFTQTNPPSAEIADWCQLKAAEYGWSFYDLSTALFFVVHKPELPGRPTPKEERPS